MNTKRYTIGLDDHDSPVAGCTTHFSFLLIKELEREGLKLVGFPRLVRLNPNIPWKTRGNAAVNFTVETDRDPSEVLDLIWDKSLQYVSEISKGTQYGRSPGVAIVKDVRTNELGWLYRKAVTDVVTRDLVEKIAVKTGVLFQGGRGVVGSVSSMGFRGEGKTLELLTYRLPENWEKRREVDLQSLINFEERYFPDVYANVDYINGKPLILSHGRDPVLFGIRGRNPSVLLEGLKMIEVSEMIDGFMIFETNQGTDHHFLRIGDKPYQSIIAEVEVKDVKIMPGGDCIIFSTHGTMIVYKETGELNDMTRELMEGDVIRVYGAVKPSVSFGKIIEPERIEVLRLSSVTKYLNPKCPKCGNSSESLGKNKGFRCRRCNYRFNSEKIPIEYHRRISIGTYQSRYYRHLTRPIFWENES